ncbi:porin family protein [Pseudochryseolinea flava]|uniref:Outer membrane protein beta-barrel domain-containing protein n=1 Tax=Pseudochryseolinea flava TaxID=2059302 RepID=A0A364Y5H9_9BACT|nr:outer membrane beta-barrel protein [Pseudochryseolinea flava]RAW01321.1 hypothetical protein DQQ10_10465 [Pseudochryseolinea flava]
MKKHYLYVLLCLFATLQLSAQSSLSKKKRQPSAYNKQNKENDQFLQKQFWLGLKAGTNLSSVTIENRYAIFSPIDGFETPKKYDRYKGLGTQIALELSFSFKGFSISFQPTYQHALFSYSKEYFWGGTEEGALSLEMTYDHKHKVDHLLFPLLVKYEVAGNKLRPYLQAGFYQGLRVSANKDITIRGVDHASGGDNEFEKESIAIDATNLFAKNHWGLIGGAGVYYNQGNVRLNLDIQYRHGMSSIISNKNRYENDMLVGAGEVMDDLSLQSVSVSLGCLFPMRFLGTGFKSSDRKK